MTIKRIKTGIEGFDKIVGGGIPSGSAVMISGSAGSGKTIFALQTLCFRAGKGEKGLYVTFEQTPEDAIEQAEQFKWGAESLAKKGVLKVMRMVYPHPNQEKGGFEAVLDERNLPESLMKTVVEQIKKYKPKNVVIDSLSTIGNSLRSDVPDSKKKDLILDLIELLKAEHMDLIILTTEMSRGGNAKDEVYEYVVDGVVILHKISTGMGVSRMLSVEKMRKTNHNIERFPVEIKDGSGIVINIAEESMK